MLPDIHLASVGVYLPPTRVDTADAVAQGLYPEQLRAEHEQVSVSVAGDMPAPDMAILAGKQALERSGHDPDDIGLLIHVSTFHQGPDGWAPAHYVQRYTIGTSIPSLEVRQGCNSMVAALDLAVGWLHADPSRTAVMVTAADNFGAPTVDRWTVHPGCVAGDGASAIVISKRPGIAQVLAVGQSTLPDLEEMRRSGVPLFPPGPTVAARMDMGAPVVHFRQQGGDMRMVGTRINDALSALLKNTLDAAGIGLSDVTRVTHMNMAPGRTRDKMLVPLGIDGAKAVTDLGTRLGHMGASDQIIGLDHLLSTGRLAAGDHVLMVGVGPGVDLSCAVLRMRGGE
jgi:3-oxoacyl-[acyl-carrier-protein] synthase III